MESLFNKVRLATLLKRNSSTGVFLWILRNFKNTYFQKYLRTASSFVSFYPFHSCLLECTLTCDLCLSCWYCMEEPCESEKSCGKNLEVKLCRSLLRRPFTYEYPRNQNNWENREADSRGEPAVRSPLFFVKVCFLEKIYKNKWQRFLFIHLS